MKFRRERVLFSLVALTVPNDPNQTLAFMVGHGRSLHLKKLQYSIKPLVENSNTKQISDDQEFDPLLLLSTETGSGGKEILEDDSREAKIITSSPSKTKVISGQEPRPFPFSLIVDQQEIKHALLLAAVNPNSIGVLISGGRGTAKSVLARSMEKIVPQYIERIEGSEYNIDPEGKYGIDSLLMGQLNDKKAHCLLEHLPTEFVPTPFVQIPLGCMEDSLIGTVDLEQSLDTGVAKFSPGLLAKSHRGILYVDEVNLLDDEIVDILIKVLSDGSVTVEREGLSVKYPCRPLMIATYNLQEGEIREHLLDRFAIALRADSCPLNVQERVACVDNVIEYIDKTGDADEKLKLATSEEQRLRTNVEIARTLLPNITMTQSQIQYLCEEASKGECEGQRAEIFATEIAKSSAALDGRTKVNAEDLQKAVILAIIPRANVMPSEQLESGEATPDTFRPPEPTSELQPIMEQPPPRETTDNDTHEKENEDAEQRVEDEQEPEEDTDADEQQNDDNSPIPAEFIFGVKEVKLSPSLLKLSRWTRKGKGGKRAKIFSLLRGRFVKAIFPKGNKGSMLAIGATLRASAPHQKIRHKRAIGTSLQNRVVIVRKEDFRIQRMSRKSGTLVTFLVDASGSMALNRMNAAKGAAISLLGEAYKSRDKISLISFGGAKAEVLIPPTKSIALTKNRLEAMPCGGGSPLAHGLTLAVRTGLNTMKVKHDVGRVVIVCITDGRANIPLELSMDNKFTTTTDPDSKDGMPSRKFLKDEVLACAKKLSALPDFDLVVVDTEDVFLHTGIAKEMAMEALGKYHHLDSADSAAVAAITRQKLQESK